MSDQIAAYRRQHTQVSFSIQVKDRAEGIRALTSFEADLALLLDPPPSSEFREQRKRWARHRKGKAAAIT